MICLIWKKDIEMRKQNFETFYGNLKPGCKPIAVLKIPYLLPAGCFVAGRFVKMYKSKNKWI